MARRNAMARRLLVLACIFLAVIQLTSVYGQETSNDGMVENADDDDADIDVYAAADDLADAGVAEVDTPEVPAESAEDVVDVIVDGGEEDVGDDAASHAAASASTKSAGGFFAKAPRKAKTGNKLCGWSWKERRCTPTNLCQYKYQFLDAIPSESCRLKDFSLSREVFKTSDVEVKPAVALAGAAGLFATDLVAIRYTSWLERFPVLFNVVQGFVLFVSGDTLFQVVEQGWKEKVGLRFWRMARSGFIGALNNGLVHYMYYKWIDKRFPYDKFTEKRWGPADGARSKLAIGFTKWAIEWPTVGIYKIASMYILTAAMSGSMKGLWERMGDSFFLTWLRSLQVWPIYDMILYAYVPTAHRPLFNSFMSIAWGGYLSHVSQPHEEDEHGEDIAEATS